MTPTKGLLLLLSMLLLITLVAAELPEETPATNLMNDYTGLLSEEDIQRIVLPQKELYDSGLAQYAIVIIHSTEEYDMPTYAYQVAEGKLGDTVKDNGLLLLIALQNRQYRFETGRGLEGTLPDIQLAFIARDYLEPNFASGDYAEGLYQTNLAIQAILQNDTDSEYYRAPPPTKKQNKWLQLLFRNPFIIFFIIMIIISLFNRKKGKSDGDLFNALILGSMLGRGGHGGGGLGGGGFGGFGGGGFGGGGAGGNW